ncbi:MAG: hypothetical protein WCK51_05100 [Armatimonadota bacterium]
MLTNQDELGGAPVAMQTVRLQNPGRDTRLNNIGAEVQCRVADPDDRLCTCWLTLTLWDRFAITLGPIRGV